MGSSGPSIVLRMIFGKVLMGPVPVVGAAGESGTCYVSSISLDDGLKRFWELEECNFKEPVHFS